MHVAMLRFIVRRPLFKTWRFWNEMDFLGAPSDALGEEIRHIMTRNRRALQEDSQEWAKVQEALEPAHLRASRLLRHDALADARESGESTLCVCVHFLLQFGVEGFVGGHD